jgi:hypothetical protein
MAQLLITIPDDKVTRVLNGFALAYGYTGFVTPGGPAETKAQFLKRKTQEWIKRAVQDAETAAVQQAAAATVKEDVEESIVLT